jgi:hypothetical protein
MQNGHVESFHGRLRDECLNATWFRTLNDVRCTLASVITLKPAIRYQFKTGQREVLRHIW